jgi:hypothetical protein
MWLFVILMSWKFFSWYQRDGGGRERRLGLFYCLILSAKVCSAFCKKSTSIYYLKYNIFWLLSSTADLDTDSLDNRQAFSGIKQLFLIINFIN